MSSHADSVTDGSKKIGEIQQPRAPNLATAGALEIKTVDENEVLTAEISQARQAGRESRNSGHGRKRARLTRENLAAFDQMAKKKAPINASASPTTDPAAESSSSTGTTSTTASGFAIQAYENGILKAWSSKPPSNIRLIHEIHHQPRHSPSPTESEYKRFVRDVNEARNEVTLLNKTSRELLKQYRDEGYTNQLDCAFSGFPKDSGINDGLSAPRPDFVEGLNMQEFYPFPINKQIKGAVLYQDDPRSLTLPQLAGEWRGRGKDMDRAELQSSYDGAALVYSRNQALAYVGKSDPPGDSQVMTFTTDGTNLNLFAHYAAPSPVDGRLQYHQYPVDSTNLTISHQRFKDGRRGLRNAQDRARQQAYILRDELTGHWEQKCRAAPEEPPLNAEDPSPNEMGGSEAV
ncbi:hypothetical protein diail_3306 [Diaporthe ilicicola]|nr:hypothetical protein diail_3306 [Diaporthe ilicicola]